MGIEERLKKLEKAMTDDERLSKIERQSIRLTAFLLLELALVALIVWSFFHLVHFVRISVL